MVFYVRSVPICCKQESWSNDLVVGRSPAGKNLSTEAEDIVGTCHQTTTGEDTEGGEDKVRAVVNCRVCELAIALWLLLFTIYKCSGNPITNPNPVYSHSYKCQYY
jgi:hypothetical protein